MAPQPPRPDGKTFLAAVTTVAAVYVYFLIFAQFGFLQAVRAHRGEGAESIRPYLLLMGIAGIVGSLVAVRCPAGIRRRRLSTGFAACLVGAACSLSGSGLGLAALLAGFGVGLVTVTLAEVLRAATGGWRLGQITGLGTGLAYAFCNLPGIFDALADNKAWIAMAAAFIGLKASQLLRPQFPPEAIQGGDYSVAGRAAWVTTFLALVCLDSALFYFIQQTPELKQILWTESGRQMLNAVVHLAIAVLAGWALDRGWIGRTVLASAATLLLSGVWIAGRYPGYPAGTLVYVASVSIYSTVLVYYPARSGRASVAALVYALAGWGGSAVGIGLAEGRADLPAFLPATAAGVLVISLMARYFASPRGPAMNENTPG